MRMKEKIHSKIFSMVSILMDNIIDPNETYQEGSDSIIANIFDQHGNKYTMDLSITVTPAILVDDDDAEDMVQLSDRVEELESKVVFLEEQVALLKSYHKSESEVSNEESG